MKVQLKTVYEDQVDSLTDTLSNEMGSISIKITLMSLRRALVNSTSRP